MATPRIPTRRLSLECAVLRAENLTASARRHIPNLHAKDNAEVHLTVMHLGRTNEIYDAVQRSRNEYAHRPLDAHRFISALREWLRKSALIVPRNSWAQGSRFTTLGGPHLAAVLEIDKLAPAIADVHELLLTSFAEFLSVELNAPHGMALLNTDPAFGFSGKSWIPHITVGQLDEPQTQETEPLRVDLGQMSVRNWRSIAAWPASPS